MEYEEGGQEFPEFVGLLTYDPELPVVDLDVEYIIDNQTPTHTEIGIVKALETEESIGQGRYFVTEGKKFGGALIKYFGNDSDVTDQIRAFREMDLDEDAIKRIRVAEKYRNQEREIRFVNQLKHPNIIKILAFLSPDGNKERINALVIEDAAEGVLKSYVERIGTQFTDGKVKLFALQLADALKYCHDMNVIHRDVRSANIYVHWDGNQIKLGNFGYAREDATLLKTANKGDDVVYKAPEIIKNQALASYGKSVDVYSFGMVVWYMAHRGEEPFQKEFRRPIKSHNNVKTYLEAGNRPAIREDLDNLIVKIITSCWINESEVAKRPSMTDVLLALRGNCWKLQSSVKSPSRSTRQQDECDFNDPPSDVLQKAEKQIIEIEKRRTKFTLFKIYKADELEIIRTEKSAGSQYLIVRTLLLNVVRLYPYLETNGPKIFHQNIISQYGLCRRNDGSSFLILEATKDGNISSYMEKNEVDGKTLLLWFLDIARGLNYLHKLDILFGGLRLENVFVYGCHAKLEHPCVANPGGIKMSPSIWEKTSEVYKFADLIEQTLSKLLYKPQIRQEKFDNNLECCLEDYLAMLASHIKSNIGKCAESFGNVYVEDRKNLSIFHRYGIFNSALNILQRGLEILTSLLTLEGQVIIKTLKTRETGTEPNNSVQSVMGTLGNMGNIVSFLEKRLINTLAPN